MTAVFRLLRCSLFCENFAERSSHKNNWALNVREQLNETNGLSVLPVNQGNNQQTRMSKSPVQDLSLNE